MNTKQIATTTSQTRSKRAQMRDDGTQQQKRRVSLVFGTALLIAFCGGCHQTLHNTGTHGGSPQANTSATDDTRIALPLLPRMAAHQRENMRDHLAAAQEMIAGLAAGDFAAVESSAKRIGYSEQMGQMCERMGAGAPGFNELALNFHHTADTIVPAAKARDSAATLKALSATLQTCVACHAVYRQQIVDEATWNKITTRSQEATKSP
jgi:hypothetical protein